MIKEIYGKKLGMTQVFGEEGSLVAVTLIEADPVCVLDKVEYSGNVKARIGCFKIPDNRVGKVKLPQKGYFDKLGVTPYRLVREVEAEEGADFSFPKEEAESLSPNEGQNKDKPAVKEEAEIKEATPDKDEKEVSEGEKAETESQVEQVPDAGEQKPAKNPREVGVDIFSEGDIVDVRAKTKGKGFAGGMKRHNWSGQPKTHGSTTHRRIGSAGASAYPSRIIKGIRMPGHMGNVYRTAKNLKVLKVDKEKNLIFVKGNVPGSRGAVVKVKKVS